MRKWVTVLTIVILEAVAIAGALPLIKRTGWSGFGDGHPITRYLALWDNKGALIGFLIIATILMTFFTRHESKLRRVITPIGIVALLFGTTKMVEYFA